MFAGHASDRCLERAVEAWAFLFPRRWGNWGPAEGRPQTARTLGAERSSTAVALPPVAAGETRICVVVPTVADRPGKRYRASNVNWSGAKRADRAAALGGNALCGRRLIRVRKALPTEGTQPHPMAARGRGQRPAKC